MSVAICRPAIRFPKPGDNRETHYLCSTLIGRVPPFQTAVGACSGAETDWQVVRRMGWTTVNCGLVAVPCGADDAWEIGRGCTSETNVCRYDHDPNAMERYGGPSGDAEMSCAGNYRLEFNI